MLGAGLAPLRVLKPRLADMRAGGTLRRRVAPVGQTTPRKRSSPHLAPQVEAGSGDVRVDILVSSSLRQGSPDAHLKHGGKASPTA